MLILCTIPPILPFFSERQKMLRKMLSNGAEQVDLRASFQAHSPQQPTPTAPIQINQIDRTLLLEMNKIAEAAGLPIRTEIRELHIVLTSGKAAVCEVLSPVLLIPPKPLMTAEALIELSIEIGQKHNFLPNDSDSVKNEAIKVALRQKFTENRFVHFAVDACAGFHEEAHYTITSLWLIFLFKYDTALDSKLGAIDQDEREKFAREVGGLNQELLSALTGNHGSPVTERPDHVRKIPDEIRSVLKNIMHSIRETYAQDLGMEPREFAAFSDSVRTYVSSGREEARRGKDFFEEMAEYLGHRNRSGAVPTVVKLHESFMKLLKEKEAEFKAVSTEFSKEEADRCLNEVICLHNDIKSKKVEDQENNPFNAVRMKQDQLSKTMDTDQAELAAYTWVVKYANDRYFTPQSSKKTSLGYLAHMKTLYSEPYLDRGILSVLTPIPVRWADANIKFCETTDRYEVA